MILGHNIVRPQRRWLFHLAGTFEEALSTLPSSSCTLWDLRGASVRFVLLLPLVFSIERRSRCWVGRGFAGGSKVRGYLFVWFWMGVGDSWKVGRRSLPTSLHWMAWYEVENWLAGRLTVSWYRSCKLCWISGVAKSKWFGTKTDWLTVGFYRSPSFERTGSYTYHRWQAWSRHLWMIQARWISDWFHNESSFLQATHTPTKAGVIKYKSISHKVNKSMR